MFNNKAIKWYLNCKKLPDLSRFGIDADTAEVLSQRMSLNVTLLFTQGLALTTINDVTITTILKPSRTFLLYDKLLTTSDGELYLVIYRRKITTLKFSKVYTGYLLFDDYRNKFVVETLFDFPEVLLRSSTLCHSYLTRWCADYFLRSARLTEIHDTYARDVARDHFGSNVAIPRVINYLGDYYDFVVE